MRPLAPEVFAEKAAAINRHLERLAQRLPPDGQSLAVGEDASDVVVLHLWQAVQITIDLAMSLVVRSGGPTPATYADAFRHLQDAGVLPADLTARLVRATGFRDRLVHAYEGLDLQLVTQAARTGPDDLRAFLRHVRPQ